MERKSSIDLFGAVLLISVMATFGINQVAISIVNDAMAPIFQVALRSAMAIPIMFLFCLYRNTQISLERSVLIPGILIGSCFATEFVLLFEAVEYTTVSRASIFFYTMPFWVAVAAHFLIPGEGLTPMRIAGLVLAIVGVAVALSDGNNAATKNMLLGDLMALLGAMCWAAIAIITRTTRFSTQRPEAQLLYQLVISAVILMPIAFSIETFREPEPFHFSIFAAQVLLVVCIGFLTWFWVLSVYPASDMASFSFLAPLFGVFFSWLILSEEITWMLILSLVLVGAGIVLINRR